LESARVEAFAQFSHQTVVNGFSDGFFVLLKIDFKIGMSIVFAHAASSKVDNWVGNDF